MSSNKQRPTIEVSWSRHARRWANTALGVRGATLGRLRAFTTDGVIVPTGRPVTDLQHAHAQVRASEQRLKADRQRYHTLIEDAVTEWKLPPADVALILGLSRQRVSQLLPDEPATDAASEE